MKRIIIGIHGLGSKPSSTLLHEWWRKSLYEGFRLIGHPRRRIPFETVYWADLMHPVPNDPEIRDKSDERYLEEPYLPSPGLCNSKSAAVRKKILDLVEKQIKQINFDEKDSFVWKHLNDLVMGNFFKELQVYYANHLDRAQGGNIAYRDVVRERLAAKLREHRGKEILLIAHSMGSIIAYDVLTRCVPEVTIHTLVTIGSPLGVPLVMQKIRLEQNLAKGEQLRAPENIAGSWHNFADLEDKVAFHYRLADDFYANSKGVAPTDVQVVNDYAVGSEHNHHKVYGYLRAAELAQLCFEFLSAGKSLASIRRLDTLFKAYEWGLNLLRISKVG
jgi:hypothetical protein